MIFVYGGLIRLVAGLPLGKFFKGIIDAQAVAYSTSSSSATLPVTLQCVQENLGVNKTVASSVLPLGATINVLTVILYAGCLFHMIFVYGGLIRLVAGLPLGKFFKGIIDAQAVAYSTSSSSATLPVTLQCVQENLGVNKTVASSVLPLGATINMDGTALYLGIVALFSAQIFGVELSFADYFLIAMTATLTSIGTAGIPSASLFLLATVLSVIGITDAQTALIVGFVLPFDRILDMARTVVNITGDATVSVLVAKSEGEIDETKFRNESVI